jgi:RNA recognition motif-containing protein
MNTRLFISNLPYEFDDAELDRFIAERGHKTASCKVITDKETGRSRGFAFVEFGTTAAAQAALTALQGQPAGDRGRPMKVDFAREREGRSGGGGGGGGHRPSGGGGGYSSGGYSHDGGRKGDRPGRGRNRDWNE